MSLSRSPSPQRGGGWSSPGLTTPYNSTSRRGSPMRVTGDANGVTWASAQARSAEVRGYPGFMARSEGWLGMHARRVSSNLANLPLFKHGGWADKEKLGRGRYQSRLQNTAKSVLRVLWKLRLWIALALVIILTPILFYATPLHRIYRKSTWGGGGSKFVIILGANKEGGVMEWKGPREWAIERDSVKNKKAYAKRWGYELEIADMSTKKRYAHEWRESWEKVDSIRNTMRKYPHAEWFWWLDLNTFIMEPSISLQSHLFNRLSENTYRDINIWNPLSIQHPLNESWLDEETRSRNGDGKTSSINMVIPQDCGGFNLGSFFVKRSIWTDRLLDIWWDPVGYEQKHMEWEHKEQDALEFMYRNQPWVRPHVAFVPQRRINSFPMGACGGSDGIPNEKVHYNENDRDFLVNMAGCEWGRDCWGEMYNFRQLSGRLNRSRYDRFKDRIHDWLQARRDAKKAKEGEGQQQTN